MAEQKKKHSIGNSKEDIALAYDHGKMPSHNGVPVCRNVKVSSNI
jgi:hypothetical protein